LIYARIPRKEENENDGSVHYQHNFFSVLAGQAFAQSTAASWTYTPRFGVPCPCIMNRASRTGPFSTMNDGTRLSQDALERQGRLMTVINIIGASFGEYSLLAQRLAALRSRFEQSPIG
jgi:hypothetical protein